MIDWTECPLVVEDPRFVSGQPALISAPRVLVDPLIDSVELYGESPEAVEEQFGVAADIVRELLSYARHHRVPSPA